MLLECPPPIHYFQSSVLRSLSAGMQRRIFQHLQLERPFLVLTLSDWPLVVHQMQRHHLIMEAAWHQCFVDREARYWEVPQAVSVDVVSARPTAGLRYRLGVHQSAGMPVESGGEVRARKVPLGALPGTWFQAAASLEKSLNLWKDGLHLRHASGKPYSLLGTSPHLSISGIVGRHLQPPLHLLKEINY